MNFKILTTAVTAASIVASAAFADNMPSGTSVDDQAAGWIWSGLSSVDGIDFYGGTAHVGGPGTYGAYTFKGTGVEVISGCGQSITLDGRKHRVGKARISIDGKAVASETPRRAGDRLAHVAGLPDGNHVLQIQADDGWIAVDYIVVLGQAASGAGQMTGAVSRSPGGRYQFADCDYFGGGIPRPGMPGFYRPGDIAVEEASDVDGGYDVGNIRSGQWFEWEHVPVQGRRRLLLRAACWQGSAQLHFVIDGLEQPAATLPITGGFQVYTTTMAGWYDFGDSPYHTIRIVCHTQDAMNLRWWQLSSH